MYYFIDLSIFYPGFECHCKDSHYITSHYSIAQHSTPRHIISMRLSIKRMNISHFLFSLLTLLTTPQSHCQWSTTGAQESAFLVQEALVLWQEVMHNLPLRSPTGTYVRAKSAYTHAHSSVYFYDLADSFLLPFFLYLILLLMIIWSLKCFCDWNILLLLFELIQYSQPFLHN